MILVPTAIGIAGAVAGYFLGDVLVHFAFKNHPFRCCVAAAAIGAVIGGWVGWWLLEQQCRQYYRRILKECEAEILNLA